MVSLPQSGGAQSASAAAHQLPDSAALTAPLTWISHNLQQLSSWFEVKLGKASWGFVLRFLPLIGALLGILVLWKLGKP